MPIVVGYYHDALGDAVTTPIYDAFYRYFPGFQMFRFSYKWVAGIVVGICGLYALGTYSIVSWLREQIAAFAGSERDRLRWLVPAVSAGLVLVPILVFIPVIVHKMNYPASVLPSRNSTRERAAGQRRPASRSTLPDPVLRAIRLGQPRVLHRELAGQSSDGLWIAWQRTLGGNQHLGCAGPIAPRARACRLPATCSAYSASTRFCSATTSCRSSTSASPDEWRFNSTTLTHDLLHRVLGATAQRSDGPLHTYRLSGALPLVYGVNHPVISAWPVFSEAYLGDVNAMARGQARFDPPARSMDEFSTTMRALSPIVPLSASAVRNLAVNASLAQGTIVRPSSANVKWAEPFKLAAGSVYTIFAREQSLLFPQAAPRILQVNGAYFRPNASGGAWAEYGQVLLSRGKHWVSDGYEDPKLVVALVKTDDVDAWTKRIGALGAAMPQNRALEKLVYGKKARFLCRRPVRIA